MSVTLDQLAADAQAISTKSPAIRQYALDLVEYLREQAQPIPAPTPTHLFQDEFMGDLAQWINLDGISWGGVSPSKASNAYIDNGNLVLRATRNADGSYSGAIVGTFQWGTGWPPKTLHSWPVPFRYETRILYNSTPGTWQTGGWLSNVDVQGSAGTEIDCGELRGTYPTVLGLNQHLWSGSTDTRPEGAHATITAGQWHTVAVEARTTGTTYFVDGVQVAAHSGVSGSFGVLLHNAIAPTSSWGSGGQNPAATDPGPWYTRIDYVRVTAL